MSQYGISVREILKRTVIVEAESFEEAMQKVIAAVERDEIILEADDYEDREIVPSEYWDDGKVPDGEDVSFYYLVKEKNTSIKNAIFISVWDDGIRVPGKCKVNNNTKEVFDIELVNVGDIDLEILESEYVVIDGIEFPVSRYGEDDTEYWYL